MNRVLTGLAVAVLMSLGLVGTVAAVDATLTGTGVCTGEHSFQDRYLFTLSADWPDGYIQVSGDPAFAGWSVLPHVIEATDTYRWRGDFAPLYARLDADHPIVEVGSVPCPEYVEPDESVAPEPEASFAAFAARLAVAPLRNTDKVQLCHRTSSDSNPYVLIEIDQSAVDTHLNNGQGHPAKTNEDGSPRNDFLYVKGEAECEPGDEPGEEPEATPEATPTPTPEATPTPTPEATPSPTPEATATPTPSTTPVPAALETAPPTDVAPDGEPASSPPVWLIVIVGLTFGLLGAFVTSRR